MARRIGDPFVLARTLVCALSIRWNPDLSAYRLACATEAAHHAEVSGQPALWLEAVSWRMFENFELAALEPWRDDLEWLDQYSRRMRQPFYQYWTLAARSMHALHEGRFDEAESLADDALEIIGRRMPGLDAVGMHGVRMFTLFHEQGRLHEVAPLVKRFVSAPSGDEPWRPGLALIYAELGMIDEARAEFEAAACGKSGAFSELPRDGLWVAAVVYLSQVCAVLDDSDRAASLYRMLSPYTGRNLVAGTTVVSFAAADTYLGLLATTLRSWRDAQRHFEAAIALNDRQNARPAATRARVAYARMLRRRGAVSDLAEIASLEAAAAATARALGMKAVLEQLGASSSRAVLEEPIPAGLTTRELEVLRLMAVGRTNRDIAAALAISVNTIATHVRNVLSKTESANRTEAARFASEHGLVRHQPLSARPRTADTPRA